MRKKSISRKCKNCKKKFYTYPYMIKAKKGIFCGNSCSTGYRNKLNKKTTHELFLSNIDIKDTGCWFYKVGQSYGRITLRQKKEIKAHRYSYIYHKGKIPKGLIVCHHCDNKRCVNPDHLYAGTPMQNVIDRENRSNPKYPKGSTHYKTKLSDSDVLKIRILLNQGVQGKNIAAKYNVGEFCISAIKTRKTWKHL